MRYRYVQDPRAKDDARYDRTFLYVPFGVMYRFQKLRNLKQFHPTRFNREEAKKEFKLLRKIFPRPCMWT